MYLLYSPSLMPYSLAVNLWSQWTAIFNRRFFPREPAGTRSRHIAETIPSWAEALFLLPTPAGYDGRRSQAPTVAPLHVWPGGGHAASAFWDSASAAPA
jgi:hypothetical protein